jgi:hypothetical protein
MVSVVLCSNRWLRYWVSNRFALESRIAQDGASDAQKMALNECQVGFSSTPNFNAAIPGDEPGGAGYQCDLVRLFAQRGQFPGYICAAMVICMPSVGSMD